MLPSLITPKTHTEGRLLQCGEPAVAHAKSLPATVSTSPCENTMTRFSGTGFAR
jgi:hypothetical protein